MLLAPLHPTCVTDPNTFNFDSSDLDPNSTETQKLLSQKKVPEVKIFNTRKITSKASKNSVNITYILDRLYVTMFYNFLKYGVTVKT